MISDDQRARSGERKAGRQGGREEERKGGRGEGRKGGRKGGREGRGQITQASRATQVGREGTGKQAGKQAG